ncbi:hypothetical protein MesoLj113a_28000 [Mesorhizobium sp. 113-1-2]|nr:Predicted protein [Mesorhizobium loti]BCG71642.1 hypothetical protein MesoLj113a_28000 [Mesorhizobium sp. 113-1-2]
MRRQHNPHECDTKGEISGAADEAESEADEADRDQPAKVTKSNCKEEEGVVGSKSLRLLKSATKGAAFSISEQAALQKECSCRNRISLALIRKTFAERLYLGGVRGLACSGRWQGALRRRRWGSARRLVC